MDSPAAMATSPIETARSSEDFTEPSAPISERMPCATAYTEELSFAPATRRPVLILF